MQAAYKARAKARAKAWVLAYLLEHPCVDCGETDPRVLEFDHIDPATKVRSISRMVGDGMAVPKVQAEAAKCEVRCCNCHRRRSLDEGHGSFRRPPGGLS